jgi:methanogenic corrinoid protein MtbC1
MTREEVQRRTVHISENNSSYQNQVQSLTNAMIAFDEKEFNKILSINILKLGMMETMTEIIFPFLQHVGILWLSGSTNVAHEHFITHLVKQRLYVSIDQITTPIMPGAKKFILFLPNSENHELSLLFASYILKTRGHEVIYVGSSTPVDDLNHLCKVHKPDVLFCAITNANSNMPIQVYVNTLHRNWADIPICLTGNQIVRRRDLKVPENCHIISTPQTFIDFLDNGAK